MATEEFEALEIPVVGVKFGVVFDGQGGQMYVGGQAPGGSRLGKQFPKNGQMLWPWVEEGNPRLRQPGFHMLYRNACGKRDA